MKSFKNIDSALKYIVDTYGIKILSDSKKLNSLLMDLVPENTKHRNILKIAISANIPNKILYASKLDEADREIVISECKLILYDDYAIEKEWADFAVNCISYVLGLKKSNLIQPDEMLANVIRTMYNS